ncbi:hypothetical protein F5878DRAFT_666753 [Lentinula raphanica]|uniref:Uncharacterized protein n=1 Tax=Lentinula raphanica TaxID=153919 RepID=A0AA38NX36_9AGAR|nr:hypothetical protein F5878DRAFT_666753 [Lentinula raphanica]
MLSWENLLNPLPSTVSGTEDPAITPLAVSVLYDVRVNRQTTVKELFHYAKNTIVEYPKTASGDKAIGHLFEMDTSMEWISPSRSFAYSLGKPDGSRTPVYSNLLLASDVLITPESMHKNQTHTSGSRFHRSLELERERQETNDSLGQSLMKKTLDYWACLRDNGCGCELQQDTIYEAHELEYYNTIHNSPRKKKRGHTSKATCKGRIVLRYTSADKPYLCCEHFDSKTSRKHFCDFSIGHDIYHTDYLLALSTGNSADIYKWEKQALDLGYGPLMACRTVRNHSTIRIDCPQQHRASDGTMYMTEMINLGCQSTFHIYEPLPEYRRQCSKVLVVCSGEHTHPVPASTKTPPNLRTKILEILCTSMVKELPEMTPRRFLRHPIVQEFIRSQVPFVNQPQLSDVHPSLNNNDHLRAYITQAQKVVFPAGSGWEGEFTFICISFVRLYMFAFNSYMFAFNSYMFTFAFDTFAFDTFAFAFNTFAFAFDTFVFACDSFTFTFAFDSFTFAFEFAFDSFTFAFGSYMFVFAFGSYMFVFAFGSYMFMFAFACSHSIRFAFVFLAAAVAILFSVT